MAIKITLKNSVVQDSVPTTTHLPAVGELALNANINSLGIYMRASDNTIVKMAGPGSVTTPAASTTVAGISEYATNTETTTGTSTTRSVTPAGLAAVTSAERSTSNSTYLALAGGTLAGVLQATAGSNSAPAIHFGDSDSGIFGGTNTVSLAAGGTTRLTADTGVSVVGTLAVTGAITSTSNLTIADKIIHSGDTDTAIRFPGADKVSIETGGSERARIDASGRLLVGTTSSMTVGTTSTGKLQLSAIDSAASIAISRFSANTNPPVLNFGKARGADVGTMTIVQDNDDLGEINFSGCDGVNVGTISSRIRGAVDGTPAADDIPGRIEFWTFRESNNTLTKALDILNNGQVRVPDDGIFAAGNSSDLKIWHDGTDSIIRNTTGDLYIQNSASDIEIAAEDNVYIKNYDGQTYARFMEDGASELYHNNAKKFETTSDGVKLPDGQNLTLGDGGDVKLKHQSGHFEVNNITGNTYFQSNGSFNLRGKHSGSTETMLIGNVGGAVELYYDDAKKLETTSYGASMDGLLNFNNSGDKILLPDSGKIILGASSDLQIYHNGSHSYIKDAGTGDFNIISNTIQFSNAANDEFLGRFVENGAVELYYDNTKRFETGPGYNLSTGDISPSASGTYNLGGTSAKWNNAYFAGNVYLYDNDKLLLGDVADLQIYHDGSHNKIAGLNGNTHIETGGTVEINKGTTENMAKFISDGAVELYHDGAKKFETHQYGVDISGNVYIGDSGEGKLLIGAGEDLHIYHNGTNSYIDNNTGHLVLRTNVASDVGGDVYLKPHDNENGLIVLHDAGVNLYYDNSKKFETTSDGIKLSGNGYADFPDNGRIRMGADYDLAVYHDGSNSKIENNTGELRLQNSTWIKYQSDSGHLFHNASASETLARFNNNGAVQLYYDNVLRLGTNSDGAQVFGNLYHADNSKDYYGNSNDLQIYHDGSDSYIKDAGTGKLRLLTDSFRVSNAADSENLIAGEENGSVSLFYDSSKKFETSATGIKVHGLDTGAGNSDLRYSSSDGVVTYDTSSRLVKTDIEDSPYGIDIVKQLKPRKYKRTDQQDTPIEIGFVADEVQSLIPEIVPTGPKSIFTKNNSDTEIIPVNVDYRKLTVVLTTALQEAITKIETLETKVAALEGA